MFGLAISPTTDLSSGKHEVESQLPNFLSGQILLTVNGRSALYLLIQELKPRQIWLPSYLCCVVADAVQKANAPRLRYYEVDEHLNLRGDSWFSEIREGDVLVAIDYFGFPYTPQLLQAAQNQGAWLVEDASQALLSEHASQKADFTFYSPRKILGVPDGGILKTSNQQNFPIITLKKPPDIWWLQTFQACLLRREFDRGSNHHEWYNLFRASEQKAPTGYYAMSELSQLLLCHAFDYEAIRQQRVQNYQFLSQALGDLLLFPHLTEGTVPVGCPIVHSKRDALRQALFASNIYPPTHWKIESCVPSNFQNSLTLSQTILTLPCDQRYNLEDMERMTTLIQQELKTI